MDRVDIIRILTLVIPLFYFLPLLIAFARHHRAKLAIFVTNLLLGITGVGWLVALIWACNSNVEPAAARN